MRVSDKGIKFLKAREGEILHGYKDSAGYLTVGVGHLVKPGEPYKLNQKITQAESTRLLREDLARFEKCVNDSVEVPITQNQFDALVSLAFNIGESAFKRSSVLRRLNSRRFSDAADAFLAWNKAGGKVSKGLVARRNLEKALFLTKDSLSDRPAKPRAEAKSSVNPQNTSAENAGLINTDSAPTNSGGNNKTEPEAAQTPPLPDNSVGTDTTTKTESVLQKVQSVGDTVETYTEKITNIQNSFAPISNASWFMTLLTKLLGVMLLVAGFVKDNWIELLIAFGLILVAAWIYNQAKTRATEKAIALQGAEANRTV